MELKYHRPTYELLGRSAERAVEAARILDERQRTCGVVFPASFVEWYSAEDALGVLSEIFEEDSLDSSHWSEDVANSGVLALPGCCSQAGWHFVRIGEGDNPPVCGAEWDKEPVSGPTFADFIFTLVWDFCCEAVSARTKKSMPSDAEKSFLEENFTIRPSTCWPGRTTHRFQQGDWMLTTMEDDDLGSIWDLNAESPDSLLALTRALSPLGIQAEKVLASHDAFKRACPSCRSVISTLDERCSWCGVTFDS